MIWVQINGLSRLNRQVFSTFSNKYLISLYYKNSVWVICSFFARRLFFDITYSMADRYFGGILIYLLR